MSIKDNNVTIAKNSILLAIRMIIILFLSLYTTKVTLKALGINDFGLYNVVCGFVSMFAFMNITMSNAIQRFYNYEFGKNGIKGAQKVYNSAFLIQLLLVLIVVLLAETLGVWYLNFKMIIASERLFTANIIFQTSILSFVFIILQAPYSGVVMAHEKMGLYALITLLDAIFKFIIAYLISFVDNFDKLQLYGILMAFISIINFGIFYIYSKRNFAEIKIDIKIATSHFRSILYFSLWNMMSTFTTMLREQGVNLLLNSFFGAAINAARGVAMQVIAGLNGLTQNLTTASRPQLIQSYSQGNIDRSVSIMFGISKLSYVFFIMISIPIIIEINYVLKIWLGNNIPDYASSFIIITILTGIIDNFNSPVSALVHATGKVKYYQVLRSIISLGTLPAAYILLRFGYSPNSAFLVNLLITFIGQIVSLYILRTLVNVSLLLYMKQVILPSFIVTLITIPLPLFIFNNFNESFYRFALILCISLIVASASSFFVLLRKKERQIVINFVQSKLNK